MGFCLTFDLWRRLPGSPGAPHDGVLPTELQNWDLYTRAGEGSLGESNVTYKHAEHKRTDFCGLRDAATDKPWVLNQLALLYKYWIAVTDCDGFRVDTVKHVAIEFWLDAIGDGV
jgi:glycosidase